MVTEEILVDFYNGAHVLQVVATWAHAVANRQLILEQLASFEKAYEELIQAHAAGKLGVGEADFSTENFERVKRIRRLLQSGLDSSEALQAAQEIHSLAEGCLQGLTRSEASSADRDA